MEFPHHTHSLLEIAAMQLEVTRIAPCTLEKEFKTYVVGTQKNRHNKTVILGTQTNVKHDH